jgi:hypothetical protein
MDDIAAAELVIDGFGDDDRPPKVIVDRYQVWSERWPDPAVLAGFLAASAETAR